MSNVSSRYIKLDHLCERLFSLTKILLSDRRKRLEPYHLELTVFLRMNKELWNEVTIEEIIQNQSAAVDQPVISTVAEADNDSDEEEEYGNDNE